jgi:tetratricopeptide (TPR) repeat protein
MFGDRRSGLGKLLLMGCASAVLASVVNAQGAGASASASGAASGAAAKNSTTVGRDMSLTNPEVALALIRPPEKKEAKAYETFNAVPVSDVANKIKAGEKFLNDYPKSELVKYVYPVLVVCYIQSNQMGKGMATAQKDFDANPKDYRTMAVLSQSLARTYDPSTPNADDQLMKADSYGKKALEGISAQTRPEGMTDDTFAALKKEIEAMAHSGIGLVLLRQNKFPEAIVEIEKAVKSNDADQTNYFLLGVANQNSNHFSEAAEAFGKCASLPGNLQATCRDGAAEAKKLAGNK